MGERYTLNFLSGGEVSIQKEKENVKRWIAVLNNTYGLLELIDPKKMYLFVISGITSVCRYKSHALHGCTINFHIMASSKKYNLNKWSKKPAISVNIAEDTPIEPYKEVLVEDLPLYVSFPYVTYEFMKKLRSGK